MQISLQEVTNAQRSVGRPSRGDAEAPVQSVQDLAERSGLQMAEVRRFTERAIMGELDPQRERRIRELERRIAEGAYRVEADQVVDMADRRAIADGIASF